MGEATFPVTGGSKKSTRLVPPHEKKAMQELFHAVWTGFDSTYATKYDEAEEPSASTMKRSRSPEPSTSASAPMKRPCAAELPVLLLPLTAAVGKERAVAQRPVFMLLASAMTGVKFGSDALEKDWNSYDFDEDFERGGEVELANIVGAFLYPKTLRSDVLDMFYSSSQQTSDALFDSLADILFDCGSPAVYIIISAIYCYWRFESELLHPDFQRQCVRTRARTLVHASALSFWRGDEIRGGLLEIARKWKADADTPSTKKAIKGVFDKMTVQIEAVAVAKAQKPV